MAAFETSIEIEAPPEVVFEYLTTDAGMTAWMGQHASLDPRPGGRFAVDIAGYAIRGEYLHVEPPRRVVVSWGSVGAAELPPGSSTVEFVLTATAGGTLVELTHADLPEPDLPGHQDGWQHFLPRLRIAATGGEAGADPWRPGTDRQHRDHQEN
ncbi:SRPBCC domain-containing protein [Microlunatus sp. GCM10028923]|uniref:SRPBCC family protein n=1 Tax=Microlunatus sp. GCM10028923 TaxID=3273400 RepID=UPI003620867B